MDKQYTKIIEQHWYSEEPGELLRRIDARLLSVGKNIDAITTVDLAEIDEVHIRGRTATVELGKIAGFGSPDHIIDIGSGLGGPSRYLASEFGCEVDGVDLTAEYCDVANDLSRRVGLGNRVRFRQGSALDLPFGDNSFDGAWMQHVSMNISDKDRMFREIHRVIKPGRTVAIYDPIAGSGEPLTFPVPWAHSSNTSFLVDADTTCQLLEDVGFTIEVWRDVTPLSLDWADAMTARARAGTAPLGLSLLLGRHLPEMMSNMANSLRLGRLAIVQIVAHS